MINVFVTYRLFMYLINACLLLLLLLFVVYDDVGCWLLVVGCWLLVVGADQGGDLTKSRPPQRTAGKSLCGRSIRPPAATSLSACWGQAQGPARDR